MTEALGSRPRSLSVQVVSITGYLIGVKEEIFTREFKTSIFQQLENRPEAKILRSLCTIRTALLRNYGTIISRFRSEPFCNLDKMPDLIAPQIFTYLQTQSVSIIKTNPKPMQYIIALNRMINERINAAQSLYPMWVKWEYVRKLFQMPKGSSEKAIRSTISEFNDSLNSYPYHCYINWPIHDPSAYSYDPEGNDNSTTGNVLQNDRRFLILLYHINKETFSDFRFINDIGDGVKTDLEAFLSDCEKIVLAVDCENSDPYKLCAVLGGVRETALRSGQPELFSRIQKIILFDDVHTVDAWDILKNYVSVPIEHIQTERVNDHKSLVDIQMTAGVAREHYAERVDGFLLASSDSDFWGLIKSLPTARFMVLLEKDKYGTYLTDTLNQNGISFCFMDHFAGNTNGIKTGALDIALSQHFTDFEVDLKETLDGLYEVLRVGFTDKQKNNYYTRISKRLAVEVDNEGKARIVLK